MTLADLSPQPTAKQMADSLTGVVQTEELTKVYEAAPADEGPQPISSMKIPLVSSQPMLATSPTYILTNEHTKRRNQLVWFDEQLRRHSHRIYISEALLDGLWHEGGKRFLLLSQFNIYTFDPNTRQFEKLPGFEPAPYKALKCFTLVNESTLYITYEEWAVEYAERWQADADGTSWTKIERLPLHLTSNELIGDMLAFVEGEKSFVLLTIYNDLTEQWRLELRDIATGSQEGVLLLSDSSIYHDYRVALVKNTQANVKFLAFTAASPHIIAIDSNFKQITTLNYRSPAQRMALFQDHCLIVRTIERVDLHWFY